MQVNIKIDDELYRKLKASAKQHSRTITAQLGVILSNVLNTQETINSDDYTKTQKCNSDYIETQEKNYIETPNKKHRQLIENYNNNHTNNEDEEDPYNGWKRR